MVMLKNEQSLLTMFETLHELAVTKMFGCVPASFLENDSQIEYYQLQTDQAAVHAAEGYARATGKPGIVIINDPAGVAGAVTSIATAHSDSVPLLIIAGQLFYEEMTEDAFQQLDITGMTMPITKYATKVTNLKEFPHLVASLYEISKSGRPGPVLIEILSEYLNDENIPANKLIPKAKKSETRNEKLFEIALRQITKAKQPVLFIGGGVIISEATKALQELVEKTNIPVVNSLMGIGSFPVNNRLFLGMLGMHGTFAANRAVHRADLLICVGVRFSDRVTGKIDGFSPNSKKIHVDIDPAEINKIVEVDLPIVADANEFLTYLNENLNYEIVTENSAKWVSEVTKWKKTVPRFETSQSILSPQKVIQLLDELSPEKSIVVTDVGQHQIFTAHNYAFKYPRTLLTSGGLGTMGFGFPAAIGAAVINNNSVICVSGDGSFQMNLQELQTVFAYNLPVKIAILNNGYLGMVRQWQEMFYDGRYSSVKMSSPNFADVAKSYGVKGLRAGTEEEARTIIEQAFNCDGPVLIEFNVVEEENVYPIVPPNSYNHELIISRHHNQD